MILQVYFSVFLSTDSAYGFLDAGCLTSFMAGCLNYCSFFYLCIARLTVGIPCISIFCTCCFLDISKFCFPFVVCWIYFSIFLSADSTYGFLDAGCLASFMAIYCTAIFLNRYSSFCKYCWYCHSVLIRDIVCLSVFDIDFDFSCLCVFSCFNF